MKEKSYTNDISAHHSFVVPGVFEEAESELYALIEKTYGIKLSGNPDFWFGRFDVFGIDDGRFLRDTQLRKPVSGGEKVFVIAFNFITREAQNALLKVFEEPSSNTRFFIVTPWPERLLPTLLSRVAILKLSDNAKKDLKKEHERFLSSDVSGRLEFLKEIIEEKDKASALIFLDEIERVMHENFSPEHADESYIKSFELIRKTRSYLHDRAPSVKMLLENIALSLPKR